MSYLKPTKNFAHNYVVQILRFVTNVLQTHHYLKENVYQIVLMVISALKEDAENVILNV